MESILDGMKSEIFLNEFKDTNQSGRGHSDVTVSQVSRCFELVSSISINSINGSSDDSKHDITSFHPDQTRILQIRGSNYILLSSTQLLLRICRHGLNTRKDRKKIDSAQAVMLVRGWTTWNYEAFIWPRNYRLFVFITKADLFFVNVYRFNSNCW